MPEPRRTRPYPMESTPAESAARAERPVSTTQMDTREIIDRLSDLAQLDVDAFHAYGQAIDSVEEADLRSHLERYQNDHERHYVELSRIIREHGGTPPEFSRDFKGYLIEGFTSLRSSMGTKGALKAMKTNEEMTNRKYSQASGDMRFPASLRPILERFYGDEKTHLSWIEQTLNRIA